VDIEKIKAWLEECISLMENNPGDTTPERIGSNRIVWGRPYRGRVEARAFVGLAQKKLLPAFIELQRWLVDYYRYFDEGYRTVSGETIDTLPGLILERLKFLREEINSI